VLEAMGTGTLQPFLDTDENHETGAYPQPQANGYGGYEYVVRCAEARGDSVPIRSAYWWEPDPDPAAHGWGRITGWAWIEFRGANVRRITIPKSAIGNDDGSLFYRVDFDNDGGLFEYVDGTTHLPQGLAGRGLVPNAVPRVPSYATAIP
jgi:hypothetical protein